MPALKINLDEIFADEVQQATLLLPAKPITCRACGLYRPAAQIGVLLCDECAADPAKTLADIADIVARAEASFYAAHERLDALVAQADDGTRERWGRAFAALVACNGLPNAKLERSLEATRQLGEPLSEIVKAHDAILAAVGLLGQIRKQASEARAEFAALEGGAL
jgi:hypothetical protein